MDNFNPDNVEFVETFLGKTKFQGKLKNYLYEISTEIRKFKENTFEDKYFDDFQSLRIQNIVKTYRCTKIEVFHKHLDHQERWFTLQVLLTFENESTFTYITKYQIGQNYCANEKIKFTLKRVNKAFTLFEERLKHNQLFGNDGYEFDL